MILILDNHPAFGPSNIVFYEGINKNVFFGKILISIETEEIDQNVAPTSQRKQDIIMPLNESDYWNDEIFKINLVLINGDAISSQTNHLRVSMGCENNFTGSVDLDLKEYDNMEKLKLRYIHFPTNQRPLLSLSVKLPDNRLKNQANNLLKMLTREMVNFSLKQFMYNF